jgi:hypothetical protein
MTKKGGQPGNSNALKNGARVYTLALGQLSGPMARITRGVRSYRSLPFKAVQEVRNPTLTDQHLIDSACRWEQHSSVCRWLLRQKLDKMQPGDIRETSKQIAWASDQRNRALLALNLDRDRLQDAIDALYTVPAIEDKSGPKKATK